MLIAIESEDDNSLAYIYSRMGYAHYNEFNYFLAKSLASQSANMYLELGNDKALLEVYYNLQIITTKLNQERVALEYQQKYEELSLLYPNLEIFKFINADGNIPTSDKTEYLPPIKLLCSIISALNFFAKSIKCELLFSFL